MARYYIYRNKDGQELYWNGDIRNGGKAGTSKFLQKARSFATAQEAHEEANSHGRKFLDWRVGAREAVRH